ncbi:Rne/Rng family ribonuclease [Curtobacterium flaccumfaciens pv. flaccumfaciens]|uniref:Rne/Rng family ribonuclease n=1 Tax=Curtobacterium poinsettiae TaxID=159612 RepID=UPI00217DBABF|nr:Rne/Rng family ribonuclease [Curtobacterium flaccumfaciens]MCS6575876.1 Rne/Rng family ribonuclease [Curtobacterium flaccumfaciens pv. flaccumfaciens]MCU0115118.1 Rne/Rng family ribonuclease [Curtobacterium flaccumfaciens]
MVEQNNDNTTNDENAPKRRSRLFGGRRARSSGQEARGSAEQAPHADETLALTGGADARPAASVASPGSPDSPVSPSEPTDTGAVSVAVEAVADSGAEPHDVSTLTGDLPVVTGDQSGTVTDGADADRASRPTEAAPTAEASDDAAPADEPVVPKATSTLSLIFHAPVLPDLPQRAPRFERDRDRDRDRDEDDRYDREDRFDRDRDDRDDQGGSRRRSRRRGSSADREAREPRDHQEPRRREPELITEPQRIKGSTRLEAKKQRRRDGRDAGRRRQVVSEDEFLARRESVDRQMIVRSSSSTIEIGVLEDGILAEHYITKSENVSLIGNVYLGKVQNVLPSMEAAFVDIGRGRNAVLYAGEVDWNSVDTSHGRRIEAALKPGDKVLVQVTKDPVGHKGARLTSQVSLPGRYLVYVPNGSMNGISRKLPDTERARLKKILKEVLPEHAGVIVRTAAEGATEEQLTRDVQRLTSQWEAIQKKVAGGQAPVMLHSEPDLLIKIVRDVFNEDFTKLIIDGEAAGGTIDEYLTAVAPDLKDRVVRYDGPDSFEEFRLNEQIDKALDRKVWLPSGGSLVIDRTEAMTVVDVNTGKFVGSGGNLEETVTKNNLEAAEEIVRQLRLRDIGGIIVVDFIDMVLEENRDLVLRRLVECLSRDRTKHQVAEITSLGLVQMTRKKIGVGLRESLDEVNAKINDNNADPGPSKGRRKGRGGNGNENGRSGNGGNGTGNSGSSGSSNGGSSQAHQITDDVKNALSRIAASTLSHDEQEAAAAATEAEAPSSADASTSTDSAGGEQPTGSKRRRRGRGGRGGDQQTAAAPETPEAPEATEAPEAPAAEPVVEPEARAPKASATKGSAPKAAAPSVTEPEAASAPKAKAPARRRVSSSATVTPTDNSVAILDIPIAAAPKREPRAVAPDAESLLDSVLQALPEPKQPGQGRSRSRRVSSPSISAPATPTEEPADDADGSDGAVILGS